MNFKKRKIKFPNEIKTKCNRYLSRKNLEITYFDGYMVNFTNSNLSTLSPHKILLKAADKELIILYYGDYYYKGEVYFINDTNNPCSFLKLRQLVENYF